MLRYLAFALILIHALIHLMGFLKGQDLGSFDELKLPISKGASWGWLLALILLSIGGIGFLLDVNWWVSILMIGVIISQILIFAFWQDAKYGTVANVLIGIVLLAGYSAQRFETSFREDVERIHQKIASTNSNSNLLSEDDIAHLPAPVQGYLRYTRSMGKPKITDFSVHMHGEMRQDETGKWFSFTSEQYNAIAKPSRLFFMKAHVKGLPTAGYHAYQNDDALMLIKVLSFLPVVDIQEERLFQAETVTYLNDLCIMAPAALIDERFRWESIDDLNAQVHFKNQGVEIAAVLEFAEDGRLINFRSNDRTDINRRDKIPFSTPIGDYREMNGRLLPAYGEAIWHYPEGDFTYGRFYIDRVDYNLAKVSSK